MYPGLLLIPITATRQSSRLMVATLICTYKVEKYTTIPSFAPFDTALTQVLTKIQRLRCSAICVAMKICYASVYMGKRIPNLSFTFSGNRLLSTIHLVSMDVKLVNLKKQNLLFSFGNRRFFTLFNQHKTCPQMGKSIFFAHFLLCTIKSFPNRTTSLQPLVIKFGHHFRCMLVRHFP